MEYYEQLFQTALEAVKKKHWNVQCFGLGIIYAIYFLGYVEAFNSDKRYDLLNRAEKIRSLIKRKIFRWHELDRDAQEHAIGLYYVNPEVVEFCDNHLDDGQPCLAEDALARLDWVFNPKGEKID